MHEIPCMGNPNVTWTGFFFQIQYEVLMLSGIFRRQLWYFRNYRNKNWISGISISLFFKVSTVWFAKITFSYIIYLISTFNCTYKNKIDFENYWKTYVCLEFCWLFVNFLLWKQSTQLPLPIAGILQVKLQLCTR
jgi:hypothetical protein